MLYRVVRNLHLYAGLALLLLVLMYVVTGYLQIHRPSFGEGRPRVTTTTETLEPGVMPADSTALADFICYSILHCHFRKVCYFDSVLSFIGYVVFFKRRTSF